MRPGAGYAVCIKTETTQDMAGLRIEVTRQARSCEGMTGTPQMTAGYRWFSTKGTASST